MQKGLPQFDNIPYIEYRYDPVLVGYMSKAKYYRRPILFILILIPFCIMLFGGEAKENEWYGIPIFVWEVGIGSLWIIFFSVFELLISRIETFTLTHRHEILIVTDDKIILLNDDGKTDAIVNIKDAIYTCSYHITGAGIFTIKNRNSNKKNESISFSTQLSNFENIIRKIEPNFCWASRISD
jgi:hypothetical protein